MVNEYRPSGKSSSGTSVTTPGSAVALTVVPPPSAVVMPRVTRADRSPGTNSRTIGAASAVSLPRWAALAFARATAGITCERVGVAPPETMS